MSSSNPSLRIADLAVGFAEAEAGAGAREIEGNNGGPFVEKYLNANHPENVTHRGEPWCAAFFLWCWLQAVRVTHRELPFRFTRGVDELWARLVEHGQVQKLVGGRLSPDPEQSLAPSLFLAQPGDACFWDWNRNDNPDHVNMVHHVDEDGVLYTIGGNEGTEESGAPVRVKRRGRLGELPQIYGFGRIFRAES
jgi:hypothetical protein